MKSWKFSNWVLEYDLRGWALPAAITVMPRDVIALHFLCFSLGYSLSAF